MVLFYYQAITIALNMKFLVLKAITIAPYPGLLSSGG
jgi:hypothetical protein